MEEHPAQAVGAQASSKARFTAAGDRNTLMVVQQCYMSRSMCSITPELSFYAKNADAQEAEPDASSASLDGSLQNEK